MDRYKIDSHKLLYHVDRLSQWARGETVYPIYVEISPSGKCNHRCTFCAFDYLGYQDRLLDQEILGSRLDEMGRLGVKSVMFAGEGEPLLHPGIADLVLRARNAGIDVAFTTNGALLSPSLADAIVPRCEWIKVSINAPTKELYRKIHRTKAEDFDRVMENMAYAAEMKRRGGHRCVLGMQMLLLPENWEKAPLLAERAREIGMDYLVIKPYSQNPSSKTKRYRNVRYADFLSLGEELAKFNTDRFSVVFRVNTMKKWDEGQRPYAQCLALPFWAYIDSGGDVWGCFSHIGDDHFRYGNLLEETFEQVWTGERRRERMRWAETELDAHQCRLNCRMDEPNRYLWELRHPPEHVNFI